jgi:dihydropteroate synthase
MQFKDRNLDLAQPRVMGILNVTPDSFSDGGRFNSVDAAIGQAVQMVEDGASFIDVGGESTRPGAQAVSIQQELDRTIPVIEGIKARLDTVISIDTSKAAVIEHAVKAGAGLINDVRALREGNALQIAAQSGASVCLMHMQGQPRTMQDSPEYNDVMGDICAFLNDRINACVAAGVAKSKIIIDPGFGFGKSLAHNYLILNKLEDLHSLNLPMLVGISRKSMLGTLLNRDVEQRLAGSLAAATIALMKGAHILRVHDVKQTVDTVKVVSALSSYKE